MWAASTLIPSLSHLGVGELITSAPTLPRQGEWGKS
jgi:hypothetical protein